MKQISLLRKLIKETIEEVSLEEMARIADVYALADGWEEKYKAMKPSSQTDRVIKFMTTPPTDEETGEPLAATKTNISDEYFNSNQPPANTTVNKLLDAGILVIVGKEKEKQVKAPSTGLRGRKKEIDTILKTVGDDVSRKFARGNTDFTNEEKDYIKALAKAISGKK
jgi:hypothetical protein